MEMGTIRTKVSRSHSQIRTFLSLTFCSPSPTYDMSVCLSVCASILPYSCGCYCSVSLPRCATGWDWSVVCDYGISWSYTLLENDNMFIFAFQFNILDFTMQPFTLFMNI